MNSQNAALAREVIAELRIRNQRERAQHDSDRHALEMQSLKNVAAFRDSALPYLVPAQPFQYTAWLVGHIAEHGPPTHYYDYRMPDDFYLATSDFTLPPLYGADSVNIIVPARIRVEQEVGSRHNTHNTLFMITDYTATPGLWVPVYSDTQP